MPSSSRKPVVAVFAADPRRAQRCAALLDSERYDCHSSADAWSLISSTRDANVKLVIVDVPGDASSQRPLVDALREGDTAPLLVVVADRNDLRATNGVQVLVRPVSDDELAALVNGLVRVRVTRDHALRRAGAVMAFDVVELLAYLWRERRTGELLISTLRGEVRVYLREGEVLFADRDDISDTLGRRLLDRGVIDAAQFSRAVDAIGEGNRTDNPMMLGEALLSLGAIDIATLRSELSAQTADRIALCCEAPPLGVSLTPAAADIGDKSALAPTMPAILHACVRRAPQVDVARFLAPHGHGRPSLAQPFWELADVAGLDEAEASFVTSIDGTRTIEAIRGNGSVTRDRTDQLLAALIVSNAATIETRGARCELIHRVLAGTAQSLGSPQNVESKPRQPTPDPLEAPRDPRGPRAGIDSSVLGLSAPGEGLTRQPAASAASADSLGDGGSFAGPEMATPDGVDSLGTGAFSRFTADEIEAASKAPLDDKAAAKRRQRRLEAERYSQEGHAAWRDDDLDSAQSAFAKAARLDPDAEEYVLCERWMSYQRKGRTTKRRLDKLRRLAERVHRRQHDNALAHMVLGHIMRELGRPLRARQHLELAESSDPTLPGLADERVLLEP